MMTDAVSGLNDLKERIWGAANGLLRAGFGIDGVARMLEGLASSKPAPTDPDGRLIWPEVVRLLSTGRHTASAILSHLRALGASGDPKRLAELPAAIREEMDRLVRDGATIDSIVAHLRAMGAPVSRSAVGRYKQKAERQLKRYREAQEVAGVWVAKLGENPKGDVGRLVQEMLKTAAFQTLDSMMPDEEGEEGAVAGLDPKDLALLSRTIKDVASAEKMSAELELRVRKELQVKVDAALKKAEAEAAGGTSAAAPSMAEALRRIRQDVYGLFE